MNIDSGQIYTFCKNLNEIGGVDFALALDLYNNKIHSKTTKSFLDSETKTDVSIKTKHQIFNVFAIQSIGENGKSYMLEEFLQFNTTHTVLPISIEKSLSWKGTIEKVPCPRLPIIGKNALYSDWR